MIFLLRILQLNGRDEAEEHDEAEEEIDVAEGEENEEERGDEWRYNRGERHSVA